MVERSAPEDLRVHQVEKIKLGQIRKKDKTVTVTHIKTGERNLKSNPQAHKQPVQPL